MATLQVQVVDERTELMQVQVCLEEQAAQREQLREKVTARDERIHGLENDHANAGPRAIARVG